MGNRSSSSAQQQQGPPPLLAAAVMGDFDKFRTEFDTQTKSVDELLLEIKDQQSNNVLHASSVFECVQHGYKQRKGTIIFLRNMVIGMLID